MHWNVKATVLYIINAREKSPPAAAIGPKSADAHTASVRKWARELQMSSFNPQHP